MISRMHCAPALALLVAASLASPCRAGSTIIGSPINAGGYTFTNFDFSPLTGTATGSNVNGISNSGQVVGTTVDVNGMPTFTNFSGNPLTGTLTQLNTGAGQTAFGINSAGDVVGGNGTNAFFLPNGGSLQHLTTPAGAINAFGINDNGNIVGQFTSGNNTPGFILNSATGTTFTTINQPMGITADVINAQGINNHGLVVGFYLGNDGQVHGFTATAPTTPGGPITATAVTDPTIPANPHEPGATFVFSQILGINDKGLAVGYFGDSTTSQHGYFYNTLTNSYTFLDDPAAMFHNGVEITQITGINNAGDIAGFYTDANGTFHSFIAVPVPEPSSMALLGIGVTSVAVWARRRRKTTAPSHQ
ncbi:MAG: PEP-CTERM sorting domain-containing protein [Isosphaeraceae bacterium]